MIVPKTSSSGGPVVVISLKTIHRILLTFFILTGCILYHLTSHVISNNNSSLSSSSSLSPTSLMTQQQQSPPFKSPPQQQQQQQQQSQSTTMNSATESKKTTTTRSLHHSESGMPEGFQNILQRAKSMRSKCDSSLLPSTNNKTTIVIQNSTLPDLPHFGIIQTLETFYSSSDDKRTDTQCQLPPPTECHETQFSVVFLGYRPDRVKRMKIQIYRMLAPEIWKGLVHKVILVWNGPRHLRETRFGRVLLRWSRDPNRAFEIVYPLKEGYPNDLMNRYHPTLVGNHIATKAILFYDDDGPFYSVPAITSGFELWKRNSNVQLGAMARRLDLSHDQSIREKEDLFHQTFGTDEVDKQWISLCPNNNKSQGQRRRKKQQQQEEPFESFVRYNFQHFAQTGANMVLPSGSFLHVDYLCWLWHPALEPIQTFVKTHEVHPDDMTVSTIVSHLAGRAPHVYSRRINSFPSNQTNNDNEDNTNEDNNNNNNDNQQVDESHRRLLWNDGNIGIWAMKREAAINSLMKFFGSINSGSRGWCYGTPHYDNKRHVCQPDQADYGMLPWMSPHHTPLAACPATRTSTSR